MSAYTREEDCFPSPPFGVLDTDPASPTYAFSYGYPSSLVKLRFHPGAVDVSWDGGRSWTRQTYTSEWGWPHGERHRAAEAQR